MGLIEDELSDVRKLAEHVVAGCRLVSCVKTMVRAEIKRTHFKTIVACIQFPEDYPKTPLLIELKSKTLSEKLLQGLTNVCEIEAKKLLGKPQVLKVLQFLRHFIDENPLSCCYDEINILKKSLVDGNDELKLKQKLSCLLIKVVNNKYFFKAKLVIPDIYPDTAIDIQDIEANFPPAFIRHAVGHAKELARQCVEPPLRKLKKNEPPFKPGPSLEKSIIFLIDCVKRLPGEKCQLCKEQCLSEDPECVEVDEDSSRHIERIYCGHLFHQECLLKYMKTPPFGNKKCNACGSKIYHHKWALSDKLAETRWAHEQARERELAEVEDFFK